MSRHESPECGDAILRMMNGLVRRAADGDTEAIEALARVEAFAPQATNAALRVAWHDGALGSTGYSYAHLATVTGTSRAAVQQRVARAQAPACGHYTCLGMRRCREPLVHAVEPDAVGDRPACGAAGAQAVAWRSTGRVTCPRCLG